MIRVNAIGEIAENREADEEGQQNHLQPGLSSGTFQMYVKHHEIIATDKVGATSAAAQLSENALGVSSRTSK